MLVAQRPIFRGTAQATRDGDPCFEETAGCCPFPGGLAPHGIVDVFAQRPLQRALTALSDDRFNVAPDEVTWGDVATLAHYAELLKRITDSALKEGEHAA